MRLASIHVYPLKGARGLSLASAEVEARGLRHDRRFMLVDRRGRFVSQRSHPRLALVGAELAGEVLRLGTPTHGAVELPLRPEGERLSVEVWGDRCEAVLASREASRLLSDHLGDELRLVFLPEDVRRHVDPDHARPGDQVSFADGFPVLLTSTESLVELERQVGGAVPMDRFRPNLVIDGAAPYEEDEHLAVRVGALRFRMPKRCVRCQVTTIDQSTGEPRGPEPLRSLAIRRRVGGGAAFGQNLVPDDEGTVSVGDAVVWEPAV